MIGLVVLRVVLSKKKKEDEAKRGYTDAEIKGMDNVHEDELSPPAASIIIVIVIVIVIIVIIMMIIIT